MDPAHIATWRYVWLIVASTIAGVMNAMAGGGSFFSFPAMLGVGVPPIQANATNTVALWPGQVASLLTLRKDVPRHLSLTVVLMSLLGGVTGACVLLHTGQRTFLRLIPWLILGGTVLFGASGRISKWVRRRVDHAHDDPQHVVKEHRISKLWLGIALFPVCFYIGYFGAGGGFLTMTLLAMFGMEDMHSLNALKVVSQTASNFFALVTFAVTANIVWHDCLLAMAFAAAGGYVGAKFTKRISGETLRWLVVGVGCVISAYFFLKQAHGA